MRKKRAIAVLVVIVILAAGLTFYRIINSTTFQFFGTIINKVATDEKVVALTFDDGPTEHTPEILAVLKDLNIPATFFVTGAELQQHMAYGSMIAQAGHELGNHSYSHHRMLFTPLADVKREIETTDSLIVKAGYTGRICFRPPYGKKLFSLPYYLAHNDRTTIMWDVAPDGDSNDQQSITERAVHNVLPGSVILLHVMFDDRTGSLHAVTDIVTRLQSEGYKFVTISQLLAYRKK